MVDDREDVYSKAVRAGKRTYFFDVKSTRGRDLFLTITESKKHTNDDGSASYEKHKIFLYKEDFEKFMDGLQQAFEEIDRLKAEISDLRNKAIDSLRATPKEMPLTQTNDDGEESSHDVADLELDHPGPGSEERGDVPLTDRLAPVHNPNPRPDLLHLVKRVA